MSWFNKKAKERRFCYVGIRESEQFRNEIDRFIELEQYFQNTNKVYTLSELAQISKALSENTGEIDVSKAFVWVDETELVASDSQSISIKTENVKKTSVSINHELLNFLFFVNEVERTTFAEQLKNVIRESASEIQAQDFQVVALFDSYEKMFGRPPGYLLSVFSVQTVTYTIWKTEGTEVLNVRKRIDVTNSDFLSEMQKHSSALKWNLINLRRKIECSFNDISKEENDISALLLKITDYNVNPVGYDILDALVTLGLYYNEIDPIKANAFFEKVDCDWSSISSNTVSVAFKRIGDALIKSNENNRALSWFKRGLEINPKLPVKNIIKEIERG
jgi:hypothetical protein